MRRSFASEPSRIARSATRRCSKGTWSSVPEGAPSGELCCGLLARLDLPGADDLELRREQRDTSDLFQVGPDGIGRLGVAAAEPRRQGDKARSELWHCGAVMARLLARRRFDRRAVQVPEKGLDYCGIRLPSHAGGRGRSRRELCDIRRGRLLGRHVASRSCCRSHPTNRFAASLTAGEVRSEAPGSCRISSSDFNQVMALPAPASRAASPSASA